MSRRRRGAEVGGPGEDVALGPAELDLEGVPARGVDALGGVAEDVAGADVLEDVQEAGAQLLHLSRPPHPTPGGLGDVLEEAVAAVAPLPGVDPVDHGPRASGRLHHLVVESQLTVSMPSEKTTTAERRSPPSGWRRAR